MMIVSYEALKDKEFKKKFKEANVEGDWKECRGFTAFPNGESESLMGPNKLCQVYIRINLDEEDMQSTLAHEHIHVLQYLLGSETEEAITYLIEPVLYQAVQKKK